MLLAAATDPTPFVSIFIALSAAFTAGFGYRRQRKNDEKTNNLADKTNDLDTLRTIITTLQRENTDKSEQLTALSKRIDNCEDEKTILMREVFAVRLEMAQMRSSNG